MAQVKTRTTVVRMAVARFGSTSLTPALASTAVRPAKPADSNAQCSHPIGALSFRPGDLSIHEAGADVPKCPCVLKLHVPHVFATRPELPPGLLWERPHGQADVRAHQLRRDRPA